AAIARAAVAVVAGGKRKAASAIASATGAAPARWPAGRSRGRRARTVPRRRAVARYVAAGAGPRTRHRCLRQRRLLAADQRQPAAHGRGRLAAAAVRRTRSGDGGQSAVVAGTGLSGPQGGGLGPLRTPQ